MYKGETREQFVVVGMDLYNWILFAEDKEQKPISGTYKYYPSLELLISRAVELYGIDPIYAVDATIEFMKKTLGVMDDIASIPPGTQSISESDLRKICRNIDTKYGCSFFTNDKIAEKFGVKEVE